MKRKSLSPVPKVYVQKRRKADEDESIIPLTFDPNILAGAESDTMIALQLLRRSFPAVREKIPPVILKSQVYYSVVDRTAVDRDLSDLFRKKTIRNYRISLDKPEEALLWMEDIAGVVAVAKEEDPESSELIGTYMERIVMEWPAMEISRAELCSRLALDSTERVQPLIDAGLLLLHGADYYRLSLPGLGIFVRWALRGREELKAVIKKQKFQEMTQHDLEKYKLRSSPLSTLFHVKDLVGGGILERSPTTTGYLVKLKKGKEN